jgi:hypothetical protein
MRSRLADHLRDRVCSPSSCKACAGGLADRSSPASAFDRRPRRRQNFSGSGTADEKVPTSMASSAISRAADAVVASAPVTNCQIFLRPVISGLRLDREIFARHLPGSRSKASTTNPRYSMPTPPEIPTAWRYDTGVSEGFRQTGKNVVLSWALPVPFYTNLLLCHAAAGDFSKSVAAIICTELSLQ